MKTKRSVSLLISGILALAYLIYIISYFKGNMAGAETGEEFLGGTIATALVTPHIVFVALAFIFNCIGYFANKFWAALTGGILYVVGGLLFILYFLFVVPSIILSFVGCANLKKINARNSKQPSDHQ
ncbi:MAG TPA: hypothetical protein GXX17_01675 [Clostridiales bacterium]|nr:hypothetical protein [Clostridiales bacterium]